MKQNFAYLAIFYFFQGLKHLHDNNMVHMDIKPANLFIGLDGLCKIGDFGLVLELSKVSIFYYCQLCSMSTFCGNHVSCSIPSTSTEFGGRGRVGNY